MTPSRFRQRNLLFPAMRRFALAVAMASGFLFCSTAGAFIYTVGRSGTSGNCSFPTVQQALDAAAATPEADEVWITRDVDDGYYRGQALVANRRPPNVPDPGALTIVGGFDDCIDTAPSDLTELDGNGGVAAPVLTILGGVVSIEGLRFTRGDAVTNVGSYGGGIAYVGAGSLGIYRSMIDNNDAGQGGGIAVVAVGGDASVNVQYSQIVDNRAQTVGGGVLVLSNGVHARLSVSNGASLNRNFAAEGGGGIAMNGHSSLDMVSDAGGLQVDANGTLGDGGAILAVSPVSISLKAIAMPGSNGTFTGNEAQNGGVLAIGGHPRLGSSQGASTVRLNSFFGQPQIFAYNRAHTRGGVIYVASPLAGASVDVCSWNVGFEGNDATLAGSVAFALGQNTIYRNEPTCGTVPAMCQEAACNRSYGNRSTDSNGQAAAGSLFEAQDGAVVRLHNARVLNNIVLDLFRGQRTPGSLMPSIEAHEVLVAGNAARSVAQQCIGECYFAFAGVSVVDNALTGPVFRNVTTNFFLFDSIVDQPGSDLFSTDPMQFGGLPLDRVLYNAAYSGAGPTVWPGQPLFLDVARRDYRLDPRSPGVDWAPSGGKPNALDAYGHQRVVDLPWRPDLFGMRDLGAVETQPGDVEAPIFANGFDAR